MKKKIFLMLVAVLAGVSLQAQSVCFGVRGGMNISCESSHVYANLVSVDSKSRFGVNVGGMANIMLADKFDVEVELSYSMQGMRNRIAMDIIDNENNKPNYTVTSHYLNIPVSAKYFLIDGLYVECGPQVGFLLGKKSKLDGNDIGNIYNSSNTKKVDLGLLAGLGYLFDNDMFVNARYVHGFTDTSKNYKGGKNRNFQISIGYYF